MIKNLYSIYDSVAGFYSPVFIAENNAHAIRMMSQSIDMKHKTDFALWKLGTFNTETGEICDTTKPMMIQSGQSLETKEEIQ
ncbi:nonstructural protein [Microviridae sp.]|nr:nonstructural protein [Microviridae sp.]